MASAPAPGIDSFPVAEEYAVTTRKKFVGAASAGAEDKGKESVASDSVPRAGADAQRKRKAELARSPAPLTVCLSANPRVKGPENQLEVTR